MKICWDNLDKIFYDAKIQKWRMKNRKKDILEYIDSCKFCKHPFLAKSNSKKTYCSTSCSAKDRYESKYDHPMYGKKHKKESIEKMRSSHKGFRHSDDSKQKIKVAMSSKRNGKNNPMYGRKKEDSGNWKGGYDSIPLYGTYAFQIDWIEECRRNKKDPNILEVKCTYCGKWFVPSNNSIYNRLQYLKGNKRYSENRLYCSESCKRECPIFNQKLYPKGFKQATSREVQPQLRQMVLKKDNYTCQKCGSTERLHCHHIKPVVDDPIESADVDNCITYCKECHKQAHNQDGCRYNELRICA